MLLDRFLPEYDVSKRHSIEIPAPRERVFDARGRYDFGSSLVTRTLLGLRGYGWRRRRAAEGEAASLSEREHLKICRSGCRLGTPFAS